MKYCGHADLDAEMKVAIIQSNYLPWRGYFDIIDDVDLFIYYDDVQYTKNDWRNRNKIKTSNGTMWLTVTVNHASLKQKICDTQIKYESLWHQNHIQQVHNWYQKAPYYSQYIDELCELLNLEYRTISELNRSLCEWIMRKLSIDTQTICATELHPTGRRTERVLSLLKEVSATSYLSGPAAKSYIDNSLFNENGIGLEYKNYDYPVYRQLYGTFEPAVSILDLLFNTGPNAREFLKSRTPNQVVR